MKDYEQFLDIVRRGNYEFSGWDFSFINNTGRVHSSLLSWSYSSMAISLMHKANELLDMGTGGGELLSMLQPLPKNVFATEGYKPNIPIAKKTLQPLGVSVVAIEEDSCLPFNNQQFDLIINKHESYCPMEVRRIIKSNGVFFTQQVGGTDCNDINKALGAPINKEFEDWHLQTCIDELKEAGFKIHFAKEEFPIQRFYDVRALIYYLQAIPWQVEDFCVEKYESKLFDIHKTIQSEGFFDVKQHRFVVRAEAL